MRTFFFLVVSIISVFFLYYSFKYLEFDSNLVNAPYNSNIFEAIVFLGLMLLGFYLGRFFCFRNKNVYKKEVYFEDKSKKASFLENENIDSEDDFILRESKNHNSYIEKKEEHFDFSFDEIEDDLKIIEGVGPKVEEVLKRNNIKTLKELSESGYEELKYMLNGAGDNYKIINPRTWPYQAELAVNKHWGKLKDYQDFLIGGVEPDNKF